MAAVNPKTIAALKSLAGESNAVDTAVNDFFNACDRFDFVAAERHRLIAVAQMEAGLDQVMMAYRGLAEARGNN